MAMSNIAKSILKYRFEYNISQDDFATKIGTTKEKVAAWENDEEVPSERDLDKISLLIGLSVDDILSGKEKVEGTVIDEEDKKIDLHEEINDLIKQRLSEDKKALLDESATRIINKVGDRVKAKKEVADNYPRMYDKFMLRMLSTIYFIIVVIAYILMGSLANLWHPGWIIFLSIPLVGSFTRAVCNKNALLFDYTTLATIIFLLLGTLMNLWHPGWVIFLTIPLYYSIVSSIKAAIKKHRNK